MVAFEIRDFAGGAADTTLAADITSGATAATLAAAVGWPSGGAAGPFGIAIGLIDPVSKEFVSNVEKIDVGARTGTSLSSMVRGQDGTTAVAHVTGETVRHIFHARDADEANTAAANTVGRVTTKGDLIVATGANVFARRAVGANDTVLVADSAQPDGVRWSTLGAGSLATDSVGSDEIAALAVGTAELADSSVTNVKMADNSVGTVEIVAAAVTGAKIATDTITATNIAADAVGNSELGPDAVTATEIAANAVGASELADNAVDTAAIAASAVTAPKINVPAVRAVWNANTSVPSNGSTVTPVAFGGADEYDTDTMHDPVTLNTRITFNTAGVYDVGGYYQMGPPGDNSGHRGIYLRVNGTNFIAQDERVTATFAGSIRDMCHIHAEFKFAAADYVELCARQVNVPGGALDVGGGAFWASYKTVG